jgi:hypothetical protein
VSAAVGPLCVNLRERFGRQYRITYDPAYDPRHVPRDKLDPWMMQIPCRGGVVIYPYGGQLLAVEVDYRPKTAHRLRQMGLRCTQDGDREKTFVFDAADFDRVAAVVHPRKRRHCHRTPEQQRAAGERLAALARRTKAQGGPEARQAPKSAPGGPGAVWRGKTRPEASWLQQRATAGHGRGAVSPASDESPHGTAANRWAREDCIGVISSGNAPLSEEVRPRGRTVSSSTLPRRCSAPALILTAALYCSTGPSRRVDRCLALSTKLAT